MVPNPVALLTARVPALTAVLLRKYGTGPWDTVEDAVQDAFASRGIVYLKADWTNYDPAIADYLASHGRTGIPLYLVYDPKQPQQPEILPQLLTPATVIEALERIN